MRTPALFDVLPAGFVYHHEFVTPEEEAPRSAYVLDGETRTRWQHNIPAVLALRYSITFRTLRTRKTR